MKLKTIKKTKKWFEIQNDDLNLKIMRKLVNTKELLGKLNVLIAKMKNKYILTYIIEKIDAISSNEIENIHTTVDAAANDIVKKDSASPFVRYREALKTAHQKLSEKGIIQQEDIVWINNRIRGQNIGLRKTPVKIIKKDSLNKQMIHQGVDANELPELMSKLIKVINLENENLDPIIKSLLIHHQFEYMHPFSDGNGRTGRIIFAILLTKYNVLEVPASVFSYSAVKNKEKYYKALRLADQNEYTKYLEIMLDIFNSSLKMSINFAKDLNLQYEWSRKVVFENYQKTKMLDLLPHCFVGVKFSMKYLLKKIDLNNKTIKKYLNYFEDLGIIKQEVKGIYKPYKNLLIEDLIYKYWKNSK